MNLPFSKTYLTGAAAILTAVAGYVSGTLDLASTIASVFAAIQTMNLKSAIMKVK